MSPNGPLVLRWLTVPLAVMTVLSSLAAMRFSGFWPTCTSNILFYRGSARFSDLLSVVNSADSPDPYSTGFEYPPGSLALIKLLSILSAEAPPETGFAWLYGYIGDSVPQTLVENCQTGELLWSHILTVIIGAVTVALLMYWFFGAILAIRKRVMAAIITGLLFAVCFALVEIYSIVLLVVGLLSLLSLWLFRSEARWTPIYAFIPLLATAYPVVYGVDRGNLDVFVLLLVTAFAASQVYAQTRVATFIGAALLGVAVAIKLWPIFLSGALFRRKPNWVSLLGFAAAVVLTSALGVTLFELSWPATITQFAEALARNRDAVTSDWNLLFNYTWSAGLSYLLILVSGPELLQAVRPMWLGVQGWLVIISQLAAVAVLLMRRPLWQTYGLASSISLLFTTFAPPYRVAILLVAAGLLVRHLSLVNYPPRKLELFALSLLGLTIAPTYLWSLPGLTPLGVAPSGTLVGSLLLSALTITYVATILRSKPSTQEEPDLHDETAA